MKRKCTYKDPNYKHKYYQRNRKLTLKRSAKRYENNKQKLIDYAIKYNKTHKKQRKQIQKRYRKSHHVDIINYSVRYRKSHSNEIKVYEASRVRRLKTRYILENGELRRKEENFLYRLTPGFLL